MTIATQFHTGDPVVHTQSRRLLGHLREPLTIHGRSTALEFMPQRHTVAGGTLGRSPFRAYAWVGYYSDDLRVVELSVAVEYQIGDILRSGFVTPVGAATDAYLIRVGDAAKVLLDHVHQHEMRMISMLQFTRDWLGGLVSRGDRLRLEAARRETPKTIEEEGKPHD